MNQGPGFVDQGRKSAAGPRDWLSTAEASRLLGVKRETLYAYASRGLLRSATSTGAGAKGHVYCREDVDRLRARFPRIPWRGLVRGDTLQLGPHYTARVLWPLPTDVLGRGPNECSLVLAARGGAAPDAWFLGDLEHEGEARLLGDRALQDVAPRFVILKAGHHGSNTSSTAAFVAALQPDIALLSVGAYNRYHHPGRRALATLQSNACTILRSDRGGAVRFVLRGETLWLERPAARAIALGRPVDAPRGACLE